MNRSFAPPAPVDDATAKRLAALGYVSAELPEEGEDRPNPVSMLPTFEFVRSGVRALAEGRSGEAVEHLERARTVVPDSVSVYYHLAQAPCSAKPISSKKGTRRLPTSWKRRYFYGSRAISKTDNPLLASTRP